MHRLRRPLLFFALAGALAGPLAGSAAPVPKRVVIIPVQGEIADPVAYILRRGLKEAVAEHADAVVLDLKTPGGEIEVTLGMLEDLERFPGRTIAFVDNEAMSA